MQTTRLYYADSYLTEFAATLVAQRTINGQPQVALDQSAFYPEGGGQPADHGTLNGIAVRDVQVDSAGTVWHTLAAPLSSSHVAGLVDWDRRLDHLQQHCGQHVLSAVCEDLFGYKTLSFHLGASTVTIDIDTPTLSAAQAAAAEERVNALIWQDLPVTARFVSAAELAEIALRKPPTVSEHVRVVTIADVDNSACGGTHPRSTGTIGALHIRRWERSGAATRLEFLAGARALRDYRERDALLQRIAAELRGGVADAEAALARLRAEAEASRKALEQANTRLLSYEATELLAAGPVVRRVFAARELTEVRALAQQIAAQGGVALLAAQSPKPQLVFAAPPGGPDCAALLRAALAPLGGRGGGQPTLAQGGLPDPAALETALDTALAALD